MFSLPTHSRTHQIVLLAVHPSMNIVESLSPQSPSARAADEAVGVVQVAHRLTRLPRSRHLLLARMANAEILALLLVLLHLFFQLPR